MIPHLRYLLRAAQGRHDPLWVRYPRIHNGYRQPWLERIAILTRRRTAILRAHGGLMSERRQEARDFGGTNFAGYDHNLTLMKGERT